MDFPRTIQQSKCPKRRRVSLHTPTIYLSYICIRLQFSYFKLSPFTIGITKRLSLTKTSFHESGLYELSWTNHNKYKLPDNYLYNYYTLFWCETEKAHPHFCFVSKTIILSNTYYINYEFMVMIIFNETYVEPIRLQGYLNWTHVSSSATSFNVSVDDPQKNYGFSLSVNSFISTDTLYDIKSYSSGMIWETCTVGPNKSTEISSIYFILLLKQRCYLLHKVIVIYISISSRKDRTHSGEFRFFDEFRNALDARLHRQCGGSRRISCILLSCNQ